MHANQQQLQHCERYFVPLIGGLTMAAVFSNCEVSGDALLGNPATNARKDHISARRYVRPPYAQRSLYLSAVIDRPTVP